MSLFGRDSHDGWHTFKLNGYVNRESSRRILERHWFVRFILLRLRVIQFCWDWESFNVCMPVNMCTPVIMLPVWYWSKAPVLAFVVVRVLKANTMLVSVQEWWSVSSTKHYASSVILKQSNSTSFFCCTNVFKVNTTPVSVQEWWSVISTGFVSVVLVLSFKGMCSVVTKLSRVENVAGFCAPDVNGCKVQMAGT